MSKCRGTVQRLELAQVYHLEMYTVTLSLPMWALTPMSVLNRACYPIGVSSSSTCQTIWQRVWLRLDPLLLVRPLSPKTPTRSAREGARPKFFGFSAIDD